MNIKNIEDNLFSHFKYLPKMLGFNLKQENGVTIINSGLGTSMFNIVCESNISPQNLDQMIHNIIAEFNGQNFAFWLGPSSKPDNLGKTLSNYGFSKETDEHAMICNLNNLQAKESIAKKLEFKLVENAELMQDFIKLLEVYDASARPFYEKMTNPSQFEKEKLFIGYEGKTPVVIALLYFQEDIAGIFSLITKEESRGKGYGTEMMNYIMNFAKQKGMTYASLSASSDSGLRIYQRLGFESLGQFECFEWNNTISIIK